METQDDRPPYTSDVVVYENDGGIGKYTFNDHDYTVALKLAPVVGKVESVLPKHINHNYFLSTAYAYITSRIDTKTDVSKCTTDSIISSVLEAAGLGLDFAKSSGQAYLIKYYNTKLKQDICTFMPGYRGFIELAMRSGLYESINAQRILRSEYEAGKVSVKFGSHPEVIHEIDLLGDRSDDNILGVYAVATFVGTGNCQLEYMTVDQLDAVRKVAKTDFIWRANLGEMQRKTVIRRLFKTLKCSREITTALALNDQHVNLIAKSTESVEPQSTSDILDKALAVEPEAPEQITQAAETTETHSGPIVLEGQDDLFSPKAMAADVKEAQKKQSQ